MSRKSLVVVVCVSLVIALLTGCGAKEPPKFPSKPISIIVPFSAGGGTDAVARSLAKAAEPHFGQPINVVNKTGANGATGMTDGLNAAPDGYTVTMVATEIVMNYIMGTTKWKPTDFKSVLLLNSDVAAVTVNANSPYKTFEEFIAAAKTKRLKVGTNAPGGAWHIAALALQDKAGVKFNLVPFPGGAAPAITDLLGGHLDAVTVSAAEVSQHVKGGTLRILAVMSNDRLKNLKDVPTAKEKGVDAVTGVWRALTVPGKTPDPVVKIIHDNFKKAMEDPKFLDFMDKGNFGVQYMSGPEFHKFLDAEAVRLQPLFEQAGLAKK